MRTKRAPKNRRPTVSGAVGGSGTSSGLNFQVDFAIRQALDAISQALADPIEDFQISMEPRLVTMDRQVTRWDVRLSHPERMTEVKLRPRRADIVEWLDRVERGTQQDADIRFELSYGRGAGSLIGAIESLCRIAKEAGGNVARFVGLVALEKTAAIDTVLARLKAPHVSLLRVRVTPIDPESLEREIQFRLRLLVSEPNRKRLYELLFAKFHKGTEQRTTYRVRDLVREGCDAKIEFSAPPTSLPQHVAPVVVNAICILQHCETGLPTEVLAAGIDCTEREIDDSLSKYIGASGLSNENGRWDVGQIWPLLAPENGPRIIAKALRQLLEFIGTHKKSALGWRQVPNAIALAKVCKSEDHELIAGLFLKLDKLLKQTGNKRLVLEVANISLSAARRPPRTEAKTKGEAVALICGRAWAFQRIGRLTEARADGERSKQLGEDIEWWRNTAFCLKCLGRLFRMEAEQQRGNEEKFRELLRSSIGYLEDAIVSFGKTTELSDAERSAEVGDCRSLLSRTYLVAGDLVKARLAARDAIGRIKDVTSKDYADLQILLGELTYAEGDADAAISYYDAAIKAAGTSDPERSEIAARALLQKGRAAKSMSSLDQAATIWEKLEEDEPANDARWRSMVLGGRVPATAQRILKEESASVRVETIRLHEAELAGLRRSLGRRSEPAESHWRQLLPEAKKNVAVRHIEW